MGDLMQYFIAFLSVVLQLNAGSDIQICRERSKESHTNFNVLYYCYGRYHHHKEYRRREAHPARVPLPHHLPGAALHALPRGSLRPADRLQAAVHQPNLPPQGGCIFYKIHKNPSFSNKD